MKVTINDSSPKLLTIDDVPEGALFEYIPRGADYMLGLKLTGGRWANVDPDRLQGLAVCSEPFHGCDRLRTRIFTEMILR